MEGNSIAGAEAHRTREADRPYTREELAILEKLGLKPSDIKSKK